MRDLSPVGCSSLALTVSQKLNQKQFVTKKWKARKVTFGRVETSLERWKLSSNCSTMKASSCRNCGLCESHHIRSRLVA